MGELTRMRAPKSPSDLVKVIEEEGAVIVEDFLDREQLRRLNSEIDPLIHRAAPDHGGDFINESLAEFFGERTRHLTGVPGKSEVFNEEVLDHPLLLGVCDAFLLSGCARYQLNLAHVIDRGPGAERQWPHRDDEGWAVYLEEPAELQVASVIALADFTADNGATLIAPGSHRWERDRKAEDSELVAAEMPAGSAVVYLGSTIHAGGSNTTSDQWRRGMQVSYVLGWLRTEENHYLTTPLSVVRSLPRHCQALLGYAAHDAQDKQGGALGHVDLRSPDELLEKGLL